MACIQWDTQQFYQPPLTVPFSRNHILSTRTPKAAPAAAVNRRLPGAAIPTERDTATAAHGMAQSNTTASLDQVELFPNQCQAFDNVEARDQGTSQYRVVMATTDEDRNSARYPIRSK